MLPLQKQSTTTMKYRFPILAFIFALCTLAANADTFTDGVAKRIADGQFTMVLSDSPIVDDIFDRTIEQRRQGVIDYVASIFRRHMTEKDFKAWMTYKPSADEIEYEKRLKEMQDMVLKYQTVVISSDSIKALLLAGKDVQIILGKPCSDSYVKAFNHYADANGIYIGITLKKGLEVFANSIDSLQIDPILLKSWNIWENNWKNSIMNAYIDHCTEKQLNEFCRELPFQKQIDEITGEYMSNTIKLLEAAYGVSVNDFEGIFDKKHDYIVDKYGHQTVELDVSLKGIKRVYDK